MQNNGRNLTKSMFIYPIFISDDPEAEEIISSLPGQKRWGLNKLEGFLTPLVKKGLKSVILFGVPMNMTKVGCAYAVADLRTPKAAQPMIPPHPSSKLFTSCPNCSHSFFFVLMFASVNTHRQVTVGFCPLIRTPCTRISLHLTPKPPHNASPR